MGDGNRTSIKPKIALIIDRENWAFHNIAKQIVKHLNKNFDFKIIAYIHYLKNCQGFLNEVSDCDIIHFFWRAAYNDIEGLSFVNFPKNPNKKQIISTCVYDHLYLDSPFEIRARQEIFQKLAYYVCSQKLYDIYTNIPIYKKPRIIIEDGIDPDLFYPINLERFKEYKKPLVIGWAGNSEWGIQIEDFKGLKTIIKPVIKQLLLEGYNIVERYCDKSEAFIPHEEMVNYYSNIDVLVCMSKIEGTPNPVLEAMACGVPIISTDVGVVQQVTGVKQKELILAKRDHELLKQKLINLYQNRNKLEELSNENIEQMKKWTWEKQAMKFQAYFYELLDEM